ncbi:hypothetical protein BS50DRAFT_664261 [Corynespora cassiicola Philippines]|uniref:Uncharacterized protein n=1 Tax=Corynespora cassiicola Philippines TaxID=1448308 RepID=A0A2T2NV67_CORCC|nr:hypothetical protein BS50DRAFT_664261 [Corynespora cassiicola Philippines]
MMRKNKHTQSEFYSREQQLDSSEPLDIHPELQPTKPVPPLEHQNIPYPPTTYNHQTRNYSEEPNPYSMRSTNTINQHIITHNMQKLGLSQGNQIRTHTIVREKKYQFGYDSRKKKGKDPPEDEWYEENLPYANKDGHLTEKQLEKFKPQHTLLTERQSLLESNRNIESSHNRAEENSRRRRWVANASSHDQAEEKHKGKRVVSNIQTDPDPELNDRINLFVYKNSSRHLENKKKSKRREHTSSNDIDEENPDGYILDEGSPAHQIEYEQSIHDPELGEEQAYREKVLEIVDRYHDEKRSNKDIPKELFSDIFSIKKNLEELGAQEVRCKAKYASGKKIPELQGKSSQSYQIALDRLRPKVNEELERLSEKI